VYRAITIFRRIRILIGTTWGCAVRADRSAFPTGILRQIHDPTLRNVAVRKMFFHNGAIHTLKEAVEFYARRDSNPEKWYPRNGSGMVLKFDDLPPQYRDNIDIDPPFGWVHPDQSHRAMRCYSHQLELNHQGNRSRQYDDASSCGKSTRHFRVAGNAIDNGRV
jgi:hypothetical protein